MEEIILTEKIKVSESARKAGWRLLRYLWRYRVAMGVGLLCTVLATLLNAGAALFIKYIVVALDQNKLRLLSLICAGMIGAFLLKGIFSYLKTMLITWAGMKVVEDLRNAAHKTILGMSLGFFERQRSGELLSRLMNDTAMIQMFVTSTVAEAIMIPVGVIGALGVSIYFSAKLTLLSLLLSPLIVGAIAVSGQKMKRLTHSVMEAMADLQSLLWEILAAMHVIKSFTMEEHEHKRFSAENRRNVYITMKQTRIRALYAPLVELIGAAALAVIFWIGGHDVINKVPDFITHKILTKGDLLAIFMGLQQLFAQINRVSQVYLSFQQSFASAERTYSVIDMKSDIAEKPGAVELKNVSGAIEFKNVGFEYNPGETVLEGIDLRVESGTVVALVGGSGAGKTTLVKLLPRFYDVTAGAILIDGMDIRDATINSFRGHIGIVPQETMLFRATIKENIAYGRPGATHDEIIEAARSAYAHDFIMEFPDKYETLVGERGATLSGGQRQRIAIARAILKDPRILILDEATSNVDSVSEKFIQEALEKLMKGRTTFVVAHRLSTIKNADIILVMDRGRIVERGRHDDLYAAGGVYRGLYESTLSTENHTNGTNGKENES